MHNYSNSDDHSSFSILGNRNFLEPLWIRFVPEGLVTSVDANYGKGKIQRDEHWVLRIPTKNARRPDIAEIVELLAKLSKAEGIPLSSEHPAVIQIAAVLALEFRNSPDGGKESRKRLKKEAKRFGIGKELIKMLGNAAIAPSSGVRDAINRAKSRTDWVLAGTETPIGGWPWATVASEIERHCSLAGFRSSQWAIRTMLRAFSSADREALIARYENDPKYEVSTDKVGKVHIKKKRVGEDSKDTEVVSIQSESFSRLPETSALFESLFDVGFWKDAIRNAPEHKRETIKKSAVSDLLQGLHDFPWNIDSPSAQNPVNIARTWEMQCVGKAIVWHAYLKALDIPHSACLSQNHISLLVRVEGREWFFDPANSPAQLIANEIEKSDGRMLTSKTIRKSDGNAFEYEEADAEAGCYFSMMLNLANNLDIPPGGKIPIITRLISQQAPHPVMGYFSLLSEQYLKIGEIEKAFECVRREEKIHPQNVHIAEAWAEAHFANGDYAEAAAWYARKPDLGESASCAKKMGECFDKLSFPWKIGESEEADKYGKWLSKRKNPTLPQTLKWLRLDPLNPEAWRSVWLRSHGDNSFAAYEIMSLLKNPKSYSGIAKFRNAELAAATIEWMRLLFRRDEPWLIAWAEATFKAKET